MAQNDTDIDLQEDNKEPQTPFGGWANSRPHNDEDPEPSGPRPVITSEDGSQRAASPEELSTSHNGQPAAQKPIEPAIRSFSATFGVAIPSAAGAPAPKPDAPVPEAPTLAAQPVPAGAMTFAGTPHLVQFAAVKDTQLFATPGVQEAMQPGPSLPKPASEPDPFAWSPEEVPVASTEPRRQVGDDTWIGSVDASYGTTPSPFVDAQVEIPATEAEPEEPVVNPFISGQPTWQAPSLQDYTTSEPEAEKEEQPIAAEPQTEQPEPTAPSPFNFVAYGGQADEHQHAEDKAAPLFEETPLTSDVTPEATEAPTTAHDIFAPADSSAIEEQPEATEVAPSLFEETPLQPEAQQQNLFIPQAAEPPLETLLTANATPEATEAPATAPDIFASEDSSAIEEQPETTEHALSIFAETQLQTTPAPAEPAPAADIFAEAELEMDITQTDQGSETFEQAASMAGTKAAPLPMVEPTDIFAEEYLPETQPMANGQQDVHLAESMTPQTQPFDDIPEQQESMEPEAQYQETAAPYAPAETEENAFIPEVSAVNLRHLTPDAIQHILQEHALWLSSSGRNGRRANFRSANLRGMDLSQSHLAEASLRGADLSGANLSGSDLHGADLSEAFLSHADLRNTNLTAAILTRVDMRTAAFEGAVMQAADLSTSSLAGANLAGLDFSGAVMQDTDLNGANLSQANLSGTNLRGAHLMNANLSYASLHSANCRDVQFDGAILDYANLESASLKNARMQGASLIGIDITAAEEASDEHRHESLQSERELLQQEWQKLQALESQIQQLQGQMQQREMALQSDRSQVERAKRELRAEYEGMEQLMEKAHEVIARHRLHDRQFKYYGVTWFIFTILAFVSIMLFVKALEISSLDWLSVAIVLGGCTLILGLFIATTMRSIKLSNNLKRLLDVYDQLFPRTNNSGQ